LLDSLGKGAFGEIYTAVNIYSGEKVAVKVEGPLNNTSKKRKPLLFMEMDVLKKLQGYPYFCKLEAYGRFVLQTKVNSYNYIIMQLLGPSLSKLRRKCQRFSIATTALLGKQILRAIEVCHNVAGVVHRDIKPGNFCMGISPPGNGVNGTYIRSKCYMIDFGLCRSYRNSEGILREERKHVGFRGTVAYASINAHEGRDLGRVDDLWSMFYMLVEFVRGDLPWKVKDKEKVAELKKKYTNESLVANLPKPFLDIMNYLISLHFEDAPNYNYIDKLLDKLFECSGKPKNVPFDWEIPEKSEENILSESLCSNKIENNTINLAAKTSGGIYNKPTDMKSITKPNIKIDTTNISASVQSSPAVSPKYTSIFSKNNSKVLNIAAGESLNNNDSPPDYSILKLKQQQVQLRQKQKSQHTQLQLQQQQQLQYQLSLQQQQQQQQQLQLQQSPSQPHQHQHHHHHHHHHHTQEEYKTTLQQPPQQSYSGKGSYFNAHSHLKMNSLTPPSSIDKDHHDSEKLYKKALLNEINSQSDSGIDQSPISKHKSPSKNKLDSDSMIKSGSSKLKNKISAYYKAEENYQKMEVQSNFRSPKTVSKTNSPFNPGNSLSNSISLKNKVKSISPTPSPISTKSQSSLQILTGNLMKSRSHSRSPSNLSCNTSRTRYYSIQLPKDSSKNDGYNGTPDEYSKKTDRRYDIDVNDNVLMHSYSQPQSFLHHHSSHHDKKEKESKKPTSPLGKTQKFLGEDSRMKLFFKYF
jgi:tau tubulin kinase